MKAFPSDKISFAKMIISDSDRVESIVEKKRKCWLPAISSFPIMFTKSSSSGSFKVRLRVWYSQKLTYIFVNVEKSREKTKNCFKRHCSTRDNARISSIFIF